MLLKLSLATLLLVAVCIDSTNSQIDAMACALKLSGKLTECASKVKVNTASFEVNEANCCAVAAANKCSKDAILGDAECKDKLGTTIADMDKAFGDKGCGQFKCTGGAASTTATIFLTLTACLIGVWFAKN